MKRLPIIQISILILLISKLNCAFSQDYIVKLVDSEKTLTGINMTLNNGFLNFEDDQNGKTYSISSNDVYNINFQDNGLVEVIVQSLLLDTISCQLDSISQKQIFYRQENNVLKSVNKNEVFEIYFNKDRNIYKIDEYKNTYIGLHKTLFTNDLKIIRKNGKTVSIDKFISIDSTKAYFTILSNEEVIKTALKISEIDAIILKEALKKKAIKTNNTFLLSAKNNWHSVLNIENINHNTLDVKILNPSDEVISLTQKKENISGIFFFDYNSPINSYSENNFEFEGSKKEELLVKLDFNYGMGYLLAKAPDGSDSETQEYIDEMRAGYVLDANLKMFPINGFGIGVKYNQYKTSNSIESLVEDNIKVSFIGLSFTANSRLKNNLGYSFIDLSIGSVREVNNAKILNEDVKLKGSTIGVYISTGIDFRIVENISIGLQCGLMGGKIKEISVDGQKVKLDEPDSLLRIDGVVGIKLYM